MTQAPSNRYRDPSARTSTGKKGVPQGFGTEEGIKPMAWFGALLRINSVFEGGLPIRYLPRLLWLTALCVLYIGLNHFASRTTVRLARMRAETDEMRVDYITQKADYMYASKQSEVARRVAPFGLAESTVPPKKVQLSPPPGSSK